MNFARLDERPIIVAVAGPNGAGKTTFFHSHLRDAALRFVNADDLARELALDPYPAAELAGSIRKGLVRQRESFVFETVFSDPVGDKLGFLTNAAETGYTVVLCYIGLASAAASIERVAMRVSQGGHDVPHQKLKSRYRRSLANLRAAIADLPQVLVFNNTDLRRPFHQVGVFENGRRLNPKKLLPPWLPFDET